MSDGHHMLPAGGMRVVPSRYEIDDEIDEAQPKSKPNFTVSDIPLLLFEEISYHLGIGEEDSWKNPENDNRVRNRDLDLAHPHIGFKARISLRKSRDTAYFELWDGEVLDAERRHSRLSYPLLQISAGIQNAGIWAYGRGNLMAESGSVHFSMGDFSLYNPSLKLIGLIVIRASQWVLNPNRKERERYWQVERNPGGDYTGDDDD